MRYLITGSSGFIGANLRDFLISEGHDVIGLDIRDDADIVADISSLDWSELECGEIDGVVHLGAMTSVPESISKPEEYYKTNVDGSKNLFEWCNYSGVPNVVFASSAAVYGDSDAEIKTVGEEGEMGSPYAETKFIGEKIAKQNSNENTRFICLRFFNVYGPGQAIDSNYGAVIPSFINRAIKSENLEIFGDGSQTRDFVHVHDICKAIMGALQRDIGNYAIINVGSGRGTSIDSLARSVAQLAKERGVSDPEIKFENRRQGDVEHSISDIGDLDKLMDVGKMIEFSDGLENLFSHELRDFENRS